MINLIINFLYIIGFLQNTKYKKTIKFKYINKNKIYIRFK